MPHGGPQENHRLTRRTRLARFAAASAAAALLPLAATAPATAARTAVPSTAAQAATPSTAARTAVPSTVAQAATSALRASIPPPRHRGRLRITGHLRDGGTVGAAGLRWSAPRLPRGMKLLSFAVAYTWQSCAHGAKPSGGWPSGRWPSGRWPSGRWPSGRWPSGRWHCRAAADTTATPFAARHYTAGHADTGRWLRVTETAAEVVETQPSTFTFRAIRRSASRLATRPVRAYPRGQAPVTAFINGTPERRTASDAEYFGVIVPHHNSADGRALQRYRIDGGRWRPLPASRVFYTGRLRPGQHRVSVRAANRAGASTVSFRWRVAPLPPPLPCQPYHGRPCWYPPHLAAGHHPMRWDWQIGRVTPLLRTGTHAVDIYDVDGFLTTRADVSRLQAHWPARTLPHPKAVCYLDLAWEDYRPDGSPSPYGRYFPAAALGKVYYGYPQERWLDFRQLGALKPMLRERIARCARKGFSAVELDDIDSFDPPSTTGFHLTPGDAQNFLAYAFNEVHRYGMTGLWKNSPLLSWWGRRYTDGAVVEECYVYHGCFAAQLRGTSQYGITCSGLAGATPCGWDSFTADVTRQQPTGKWVGEAEYGADHYVCNPGQRCPRKRRFATFCHAVYTPPHGFAAVKFDVDLDGRVFYPCPRGT